MNRFEQRLQKRLENEEIAAGYHEMAAELELMQALDIIRKQQGICYNVVINRLHKVAMTRKEEINDEDA